MQKKVSVFVLFGCLTLLAATAAEARPMGRFFQRFRPAQRMAPQTQKVCVNGVCRNVPVTAAPPSIEQTPVAPVSATTPAPVAPIAPPAP